MEAGKLTSFTQLDAWREGHKLVIMIYEVTKNFPKEEMFGLVSQMRRSAVSYTSNVAEGFGRQSYKEKLQFYSIAQGSLTELQNQILVARDVSHIGRDKFEELATQTVIVNKIINGLIRSSKTKIPNSRF